MAYLGYWFLPGVLVSFLLIVTVILFGFLFQIPPSPFSSSFFFSYKISNTFSVFCWKVSKTLQQ